ncbi:MAG: SGNH/GDSL hydrolase family protein [Ruminococcaceae bacterium]|nr:SGNH/GDSL hydrolase family protein [Oscillospiraceae bacterium]
MKLNLSHFLSITSGAERIEEREDGFHFLRFTKEQEELYVNNKTELVNKVYSTSGIRFHFKTNSAKMFLNVVPAKFHSRFYFCFDLFVNGKLVDTIDNYSHEPLPIPYSHHKFISSEVSKEFNLGEGEKEVNLYFPWSCEATVKELTLDDNSTITPIKRDKKILCFGDSITQGYDSLHPSNKYITRFAEYLGAEEYNKAIGGEVFFPELAKSKEEHDFDYVSVAYGTNDWYKSDWETFTKDCKAFFENIAENYKNSKIFVITPIWRKEMGVNKNGWDFSKVHDYITSVVSDIPNATIVKGFDLVPHDENLYADFRLHPNDEGFDHYFNNLISKIN